MQDLEEVQKKGIVVRSIMDNLPQIKEIKR